MLNSRFLQGATQGWLPAWITSVHPSEHGESSWDILYHLGGNGPWIQKFDGILEENIEPPSGCEIEQVHMVSLLQQELEPIQERIQLSRQ